MKTHWLMIAMAAALTGCGGGEKNAPSDNVMPSVSGDTLLNEMPLATIATDVVENQGAGVRTMGKVVSACYADLSFDASLPIDRVSVKNGQRVHRGQVLAQLDPFRLRNAVEQQQRAVEQAELQIEQARLQMKDVIISQGFDPDQDSAIPDEVRHNADVKSGYALAKNQLSMAQTLLDAARHEMQAGVLVAPFDGVVANLAVQAHQLAQPGQPVCRVIADGEMEVEFRVMEADLCRYGLGTTVHVVPVANKNARCEAVVSEINPMVDEQGAVKLRARLTGTQPLFDGMNVEVIL